MSLEAKKEALIERLRAVTDEAQLTRVAQVLGDGRPSGIRQVPEAIAPFILPIEDTVDLDKIKVEQNYRGPDKAKVDAAIQEMNLELPLEELLKMVGK